MNNPISEQYIKVAADSIGELRRPDVYRVLSCVRSGNGDGMTRGDLATYITTNRPDLSEEVRDVMLEEFPADAWSAPSNEIPCR